MEKRDLIKDQIEQMGKVLAKILSDLLGMKSSGQLSIAIETTSKQFKNELDIDVNELLELDKNDLKKYLMQKKLNASHIDFISKYFEEIGRYINSEKKTEEVKYLNTALDLLELIDELSNSISFERIHRKAKIKKILEEHQ